MAKAGIGSGQGRVRTMLGKGRMFRCADELCQRAIFAGKGTQIHTAGYWRCGDKPLVPKKRTGQQKQR